MRGIIVQARSTDIVGKQPDRAFDDVIFCSTQERALDYARTQITNPDCEVRLLPGYVLTSKLGVNEIGVLH